MPFPRHRFNPRRSALKALPFVLPALAVGMARYGSASEATPYEAKARPLVESYCRCHGGENPSGQAQLLAAHWTADLLKDASTWRRALAQLKAKTMPPPGAPQPSDEDRNFLLLWLDETLNPSNAPKNPGRVLIHRLNRDEYDNTVRDLFGITSKPAESFPADGGGGGGFDNDADTLFLPPILMERYLKAADDILKEAKPERILIAQPGKTLSAKDAARRIIKRFALLGYRRPPETPEIDRLMSLYDRATTRGAKFLDAVKLPLKAILVSPNFLFRVEDDPAPGAQPRRLDDYELASRLSYFLWNTMPDDALFQLAASHRLHDPKILDGQIRRMLADPKSRAMADSFAGQWLRIRDLYTSAQPDPGKYPDYSPTLRDNMYAETVDYVYGILKGNASLLELLDSNYDYLNEDLAKLYGIPGVKGKAIRRVSLNDGHRGGVLTMASVLTVTSYPQRTSPVLRGKWVLEQILGTPPPPPPPNAGGLSPNDGNEDGLTFRQRLEQHRSKPECASCHSHMDPIGFGLENYDVIGRWRDKISGDPVDASGVFDDGVKFSGPEALKKHLLSQKELFLRNLVEKMLSYALGRGLQPYDRPAVEKIVKSLDAREDDSFTLISGIVGSYPFQYRANPPAEKIAALK
jgi:hypothetical protein